MSLDNIQLSPIVLQQLFKNSLTDLKNNQHSNETEPAKTLAVLGNNKKHILIIISNDDTLYLPDDQLNFLLGILSACKLSMEDVAILNINKNKAVTYKLLTAELKAEKIFLFGVSTAQLGLPLDFPNYQIQSFNSQVYLTAPLLSLLQNDKAEKTLLWNCLKQIFTI